MRKKSYYGYVFDCAAMALIAALAVIVLVMHLFNIEVNSSNQVLLIVSLSAVSGLFWFMLLLRNC